MSTCGLAKVGSYRTNFRGPQRHGRARRAAGTWLAATAALGPGSALYALPFRPNAFLRTSLPSAAHDGQHNGKNHPSSSTACFAFSALLGFITAFSPTCFQHRMKRRRRLERMEQALQTANRKTDHEFIQDFLLM